MYNPIDNVSYEDDDVDENDTEATFEYDEYGELDEKVSAKSVGPSSHGGGSGKRNIRTARGMS